MFLVCGRYCLYQESSFVTKRKTFDKMTNGWRNLFSQKLTKKTSISRRRLHDGLQDPGTRSRHHSGGQQHQIESNPVIYGLLQPLIGNKSLSNQDSGWSSQLPFGTVILSHWPSADNHRSWRGVPAIMYAQFNLETLNIVFPDSCSSCCCCCCCCCCRRRCRRRRRRGCCCRCCRRCRRCGCCCRCCCGCVAVVTVVVPVVAVDDYRYHWWCVVLEKPDWMKRGWHWLVPEGLATNDAQQFCTIYQFDDHLSRFACRILNITSKDLKWW